jgi:hypothetical protein
MLSASGMAAAQPVDAATRTAARDIALQGADAFERGDYPTALDRFQRAYALLKAPSISVMEARALERQGRLLEALDKYEQTQRTSLAADAPEAFRKAVEEAEREGNAVRARIPHLEIRVRSVRVEAQRVHVTLDRRVVPRVLLDVQQPLDPGLHEVSASMPGHEPVRRTVLLAEGETKALELDLDQEARPLPHAAPPAAPASASAANGGSSSTLGWVGVGVGGVALSVAVVTGLTAWQRKSELDAVCKPACPAGHAQEIDSFRTNRTVSYLSLGLGAGALVTGGYFLLAGSPKSRHIGALAAPGGASVMGAF